MKKRIIIFLLAVTVSAALFACKGQVKITLDYDYAGDDGNIITKQISNSDFADYNSPLSKYYPVRNGFIFDGWYYNGTLYNGESSKSITVVAKWTPKRYTITFKDSQGTVLGNYPSVSYNTTITLDGYTQKYGYQFVKWTLDGVDYTAQQEYKVLGEAVFIGEFTANKYQAAFYSDDVFGQEVNGKTFTVPIEFDQTITLPLDGFTCQGQQLIGWYCEGKIYNLGEEYTLTNDKNPAFRAVWADEE